jgi:uncharacterized membrane protein
VELTNSQAGALLNVGAVLTAVVALGWAITRLRHRDGDGEFQFLRRALLIWWFSWITWIALWALVLASRSGANQTATVILSDLNTALVLVAYFTLTRGNAFTGRQASMLIALVFAAACMIDVATLALGWLKIAPSAVVVDLQDRWSLSLSVIGPLLFGWATSLRFGHAWSFGVGLVYAAFQPFAYAVLSGKFLPQGWIIAVFGILALLKIIFAMSVLVAFNRRPRFSETLVRPAAAVPGTEAWTFVPPVVLAVTGCSVIWLLSKIAHIQLAQDAISYLATYVLSLGGVIGFVNLIGGHVASKIGGSNYVRLRAKDGDDISH